MIKNKVNFLSLGAMVIGVIIVILGSLIIRSGLQSCGWLDNVYIESGGCIYKLSRAISIKDIEFISNKFGLATASLGGQVRIWQISEDESRLIEDYNGQVEIAVSPNDDILAISAWHSVQLRRVSNGDLLRTLNGQDGIMGDVAFSPDGTKLAVAVLDYQGSQGDYKVQLWSVSDGILLHSLRGHTWFVSSVAFSPDGDFLASAGENEVKLWQTQDGKLSYTFKNDFGFIEDIVFSPDGSILASAGAGPIQLWRVNDRMLLNTLSGHSGQVYSLAFSPDGSMLASGGEDSVVQLWEIPNGKLLHRLKLGRANREWVYSLAFSPDNSTLAVAQSYAPVRIFDLQQMLQQ